MTHRESFHEPAWFQSRMASIEAMDEQVFLLAETLSDVERSARQVTFNMPASWEECEMLGLDPLTGEPT